MSDHGGYGMLARGRPCNRAVVLTQNPHSSLPVPQQLFEPRFGETYRGNLPHIDLFLPGGCGISVQDALVPQRVSCIVDANEPVSFWTRSSSIEVFVQWPGYPNASSLIQIPVMTPEGSLTRAMLTNLIAKQVSSLLNKCLSLPCSQKYAEYQVGHEGRISQRNVFLTGIYNTSEGVWQVEMYAYPRRQTL